MNADRVEIICGDDAAGRDFGPVTDIQGAARNLAHEECLAKGAASLQIKKVRPRNWHPTALATRRSGNSEQPILVGYCRIRAEQDPFDPTKYRSIGANSQGRPQ